MELALESSILPSFLNLYVWVKCGPLFLSTGSQGQPGEGPVCPGGRIRRGGEGGGSDQHRGQRGHHQGSGVELWYDASAAAAPPSDQYIV